MHADKLVGRGARVHASHLFKVPLDSVILAVDEASRRCNCASRCRQSLIPRDLNLPCPRSALKGTHSTRFVSMELWAVR
jgi:hypothetical protein